MKLKTLVAAAALAGSAGLSFAAPPAPVMLTPTGPGMFSGEFTQSVDGLFIDTFSFVPETFGGLVSVSLSSLSGPVSFFTASLNGQDFSYFPEEGHPDFAFRALVAADTSLTLMVFGAVLDADGNPAGAGAYHGAITAAVPEPQTPALLLAGLAVLAFAARRKPVVV
jgi:hypothetical protein